MLRRLWRLCIIRFPPMLEPEITPNPKRALRARMLGIRAKLDRDARERAAAAITRAGVDLPGLSSGAAVAGYVAMRGEIDPAPLIAALAERGHPIGLPVIVRREAPLEFWAWHPGAPLEKGLHGVPVPAPGAAKLVPDILFVPLVAFDCEGHRLGLGAGYYDRTLADLRGRHGITAVGVAFDEQAVDAVPHEANDQRLDWMLTPSGVFATGAQHAGEA